ncbi:MAG TPA: hypothetical protein PKY81_06445 [bacterium]|nr:hypothetical protein [bacterium]HPN30580.1 hypothetical protein [bacterium]
MRFLRLISVIGFFFTLITLDVISAGGVDSSLGQMLRGFGGNFYADCFRAGIGGQSPAMLLNPSLTYADKFSSSIELYNLNKYSEIDAASNYNSLNFILKEREFYKFTDVQFGFHYSNFSVKDIEEYDLTGNYRGKTSDEESLLLVNANMPVIIKNEKFRTGLNIKYYSHSIASYKTNSAAADAGASFIKNNFSLGVSLRNIFSTKLKYKTKSGNLPFQIGAGAGYVYKISEKTSVSCAADYIAKSSNTDNYIGLGIDFSYMFSNKLIADFIYGGDNIYVAHSLGLKINYDKKFNCGFAYSVNKNAELGDNVSVFLGWNFGTLEIERFENYAKFETEGDAFYKSGDWSNALSKWESAYKLYPAKQTRAKVSYDLLKRQVDMREKYNYELFLSNSELYLKGERFFDEKKYFESIASFSAVKFNDDFKNAELFKNAGDYIKKISSIIIETKNQPDTVVVVETFGIETVKTEYDTVSIKQFIEAFIEMDRPELANNYFNLYSGYFSETERANIKSNIELKIKENENREKIKTEFNALSEKIKQAFFENNFISVVELYGALKSKFSEAGFLDASNLAIYYEQSKLKLKEIEEKALKIDSPKPSDELMLIENYYVTAAKHYLNYLQSGTKSELIQSVKFYEKILNMAPMHKCRADYEKAKTLLKSLE